MMSDASREPVRPLAIGRRGFLLSTGTAALGGACLAQTATAGDRAAPAGRTDQAVWDLAGIPNFCGHEHWGSIGSIGRSGGGFRADAEQGATPSRRTGLVDILLDPYIGMKLAAAGVFPDDAAKPAGAKNIQDLAARSVVEAMKVLRPLLRPFRLTGIYQCIRRGLLALHGLDMESPDDEVIARLDAAVAERYRDIFGWYSLAMSKAGFSELIRPVQPEFFLHQQLAETAAAEARFTHTLLRIDPLMELWRPQSGRRELWAKTLGVEPVDAKSWRRFLGELFDLAARHKTLGIKQLQAYSRSLAFRGVADSEVVWRGELTDQQRVTFQDWVMDECCKQAHDRRWPHQVHVGTHNLPQSRPLPLGDLAAALSAHETRDAALLALPERGRLAGGELLEHVHRHQLAAAARSGLLPRGPQRLVEVRAHAQDHVRHDGTSVEMAAGSALCTREVVSTVLHEQSGVSGLSSAALRGVAADLLPEQLGRGLRHRQRIWSAVIHYRFFCRGAAFYLLFFCDRTAACPTSVLP